jgi:hypothetical protein
MDLHKKEKRENVPSVPFPLGDVEQMWLLTRKLLFALLLYKNT